MSENTRFCSNTAKPTIVIGLLLGLLYCSTCLCAQNTNYATGETGSYGNLNSNDFKALLADDNSLEKISEQKTAAVDPFVRASQEAEKVLDGLR